MNILIVAAYFHPHIGGYETNVYEFAKRLVGKGYHVGVLTCNTNSTSTFEFLDGISVFRIDCWNLLGGTYPVPKPSLNTLKVIYWLLRGSYDVVHTQTRFFITSFMGFVFAKVKRIQLVHTERGTRHSVVQNKVVVVISRLYDHTVGSLIVRLADRCVGVSQVACEFTEHLGTGSATLIPNGVDLGECGELRYLPLEGRAVVVFVGRLIYAKGVQDLITAFPLIKKEHPRAQLVIVGDGNYRPQLESMSRKVSNTIIFTGQKTRNEVLGILSVSDVFVNPSYSEGLPTSVMEASAMGLPVVATDVGGTREVVSDEVTGIIIPPHTPRLIVGSVRRLLSDRKMAQAMGSRGRGMMLLEYSWDNVVEKYCSLYDGR